MITPTREEIESIAHLLTEYGHSECADTLRALLADRDRLERELVDREAQINRIEEEAAHKESSIARVARLVELLHAQAAHEAAIQDRIKAAAGLEGYRTALTSKEPPR